MKATGIIRRVDDLGRIVFLRAGLLEEAAGAASRTVVDGFVTQEYFFDGVSTFYGSAHEFIAQRVRIAVAARTGR